MIATIQKTSGAYFTPKAVVRSLVSWAVRSAGDRILDPSCGDGRFLALHRNAVGVERDACSAADARGNAPSALVHEADFFHWAAGTLERFDAVVGNPPFIRFQHFKDRTRHAALELCGRLGVDFRGLTSSWAPFVVSAASLLRPGGRLAFVVPAEIGHAPYAVPLVQYLYDHFDRIVVVAIKDRLFDELSEDCWLLYASGYGGSADCISIASLDRFDERSSPPRCDISVSYPEWASWGFRLRPFLLPGPVRSLYLDTRAFPFTQRLRDIASVRIGYVTGDNGFFHLTPKEACNLGIGGRFLRTTVRNGRMLTSASVSRALVQKWIREDQEVLLLSIQSGAGLSKEVQRYLASEAGEKARLSYKCQNRNPWYVVPDVTVPDAFLSYMAGKLPVLAANSAGCACTNSVHAVTLKKSASRRFLLRAWKNPLTALACEIEGHPLGGGMLKLEPSEAGALPLCDSTWTTADRETIERGVAVMREWRHYAC